jgi:hypothetical protein
MHNRSGQKVGQVAQRSPQLVVEPLPASVGHHLGRHADQKPTQRLGPMELQGEDVFELIHTPSIDLPGEGFLTPETLAEVATELLAMSETLQELETEEAGAGA